MEQEIQNSAKDDAATCKRLTSQDNKLGYSFIGNNWLVKLTQQAKVYPLGLQHQLSVQADITLKPDINSPTEQWAT